MTDDDRPTHRQSLSRVAQSALLEFRPQAGPDAIVEARRVHKEEVERAEGHVEHVLATPPNAGWCAENEWLFEH